MARRSSVFVARDARHIGPMGLLAVAVTVGILLAGCSKSDTKATSTTLRGMTSSASTQTTAEVESATEDGSGTASTTTDLGTPPPSPAPPPPGSGAPAAPAQPATTPPPRRAPAPTAPPPPQTAPPAPSGGGTVTTKPPSGEITRERAIQIAVGKYGGTVVEVEADSHRGTPTWEVELTGSSLGRIEVHISRLTGEILKVDDENDHH